VRVFWTGQPVTRMSAALWDALKSYNPGGPAPEQGAAMTALLGFLIDGAKDTAEEGEPQGWYYETGHYRQLRDHSQPTQGPAGPIFTPHHMARPIYLERNETGWTVMLPSDH